MYKILELPATKRCSDCAKHKSSPEFSPSKTSSDGLQGYCKECRNAHSRKKRTPEFNHRRSLKYLYGITPEAYQELLVAQDFRCKICRIPESEAPQTGGRPRVSDGKHTRISNLHVDHHHGSKKVRSLLCTDCNIALGKVKENIHTLIRMIVYLTINS